MGREQTNPGAETGEDPRLEVEVEDETGAGEGSREGSGPGTEVGEGPRLESGSRSETETESEKKPLTQEEVRALEPLNDAGGYNVRYEGKIVSRGTPEYFKALDISPEGWAVSEKTGTAKAHPKIRVRTSKPTGKTSPRRVSRPQTRAQTKRQAAQTTAVLLTIFDGMVGSMLGPQARMDKEERTMIEEPMGRILERMDPGTSAMLEKWTDPILLAFGFITWSVRVWADMTMGGNDDDSSSGFDVQPAKPPSPQNGREKDVPDEVEIASPLDVTEHIAHAKVLEGWDNDNA